MATAIITPQRAAALLEAFVARRRLELAGPDLSLTRIDFEFDDHVDALCRRLALEPGFRLGSEPREARALLCCRILWGIHRLRDEPDQFPAFHDLGPLNDTTATAYLFALVLGRVRLPDSANGQLFGGQRPVHLN